MGTSSRRAANTKIKRILENPDLNIDQAVMSISQGIIEHLPDFIQARHRTRYFDSTMLTRAIGVGVNTAQNYTNPAYFTKMGISIPEPSDEASIQRFIEELIENAEQEGEIEEAIQGALRQGLIESLLQQQENMRAEAFVTSFFVNLILNLLDTLSSDALSEKFGAVAPEEMQSRFRNFSTAFVHERLREQILRCIRGEISVTSLVTVVLAELAVQ